MKIRKLQLTNIGPFDDETIEFQECPEDKAEIHIFTGENGTGKTTILMALVSRFDFFQKSNLVTKKNCHSLHNGFHKRFRKNSSVLIYSNYFSNGEYLHQTRLDSDLSRLFPVGFQEEQSPSDYWVSKFSKDEPFDNETTFKFAPFAFSGYRQIEDERVQANYMPKGFNPLSQSLEFIKDYRKDGEITINQLVANNISNRALSKEDGSLEESKRYEVVIDAIETFIKDVTGKEIKFVLKRSPNELKLKVNGEELDFDVLPDGLRSLISWIADLLGRVDLLKWEDDLPITEKNLILLLDEIEVHLHPKWQRKVLPVVQKLFKNSQIFVSTHSPFVVNSVDDAWVYKLKVKDGKAKVESVERSEDGKSYSYVLEETFDIKEEFGIDVQKDLEAFKDLRNQILSSTNGISKFEKEIKELGRKLAKQSEELNTIVQFEIRQINRRIGTKLTI